MQKVLVFLSLLIALFSCAPQAVFTVKKPAEPDSVLFYQQKNVADPFIDSILSQPGDSSEISIRLIPPPPPDTLRLVEGFRVQVFAGLDSVRAVSVTHKIASILQDSVYLFKDKGLYKVQTGDFIYRHLADSVQRKLTIQSIPGTWVVKRMIIVPDSVSKPSPASKIQNFKFTIQILVTSDESRALEIVSKLQGQFEFPAYYKNAGSVFKVFVGKFAVRSEADKALAQIRKNGFPDAWVVY